MGRRSAIRFAVGALVIIGVAEVTNPANAQNLNDLLRIFGADKQRAPTQAQAEWHRLPPAEMSCIDQRLRHQGSSVEALIRGGVKPSAARLVELRSSCREFVHRLQNGSAPALARDANGSQRPAIAARSPTEPKDANVTSSVEPPKDSGIASMAEPPKDSGIASMVEPPKDSDVALSAEPTKDFDVAFSEPTKDSAVSQPTESPKGSAVTLPAEPSKDSDVTLPAEPSKDSDVAPPAESPKDSSVTLPSEQSVGETAGEQVQQGDPEPKNSDPERGIKVSQLGAFLFAVAAMAALFAVVSRLFITWRNTIRRTT
jgi:hypothetical protein